MSALRDEIRAILREEIAALRAEVAPPAPRQVEQVRVASSAELNRFAQDLLRRAGDPDFAAKVMRGDLVFEMAGHSRAAQAALIVSGPPRAEPGRLDKPLITERDIAALDGSARILRIAPQSRLTPLARDAARRLGIRIERTER